ncbi:hypothetical protein [Caldicellulosiruptor sp. F32]|nr:hypothetical protein [Caldicellulosiruptor sp. F32]
MKNHKKILSFLITLTLMIVSIFYFSTHKTAAISVSAVQKTDFPNFKTIVNIPVSVDGIEYTGIIGYGSHEGPNAFDVKGDKVYVLDNVHHRVLVYSKENGNLIRRINIPNEQWIHGMAVDKEGKIYLFNAGTNTLITINNGVVDISTNKELRLEPFYKFDVNDNGPFVVLSGDKMKTCFLAKDINKNKLYVAEEREGVFSSDGSVSKVNASACKASIDTGDAFEFPRWFVNENCAYEYIGRRGFIQFWKITNDYGEWIVKLNSKTQNIEGLVKIPDGKYYFPIRDAVLEGNDVFVLVPCEKNVYVLEVDSWMTNDQYIKYKESLGSEKNLIENKNSDIQFNEQTKYISTSSLNRNQIMSIAYQYNNYKWYCSKQNFDGSKVANPNLWKRPCFITSYNTYYYQVPYCWGGGDSLSEFGQKINEGYAAGNVYTSSSGYVGGTTGVDCSGFVSKCWMLPYKWSTYDIMRYCKSISFSALQQGDALCNSGHVMLFYQKDASGNYIVYESTTGGYDRVIHRARSKSEVEGSYGAYQCP